MPRIGPWQGAENDPLTEIERVPLISLAVNENVPLAPFLSNWVSSKVPGLSSLKSAALPDCSSLKFARSSPLAVLSPAPARIGYRPGLNGTSLYLVDEA